MNECGVEISTERSEVVPEGVDPDESPFELQAIAGLPFGKNSAEATAIRRILDQADGEGAAASPWPAPAVEGLPFGKDSDEARAIERVLEQAEEDRRTTSSQED